MNFHHCLLKMRLLWGKKKPIKSWILFSKSGHLERDLGFLCTSADKRGMFEFYRCKADEDVFWCLYLWKNKDRKFGFGPVRGEFSTEFMHKRCRHLNFQPLRSFRALNSLMLFGVRSVIEQLSSHPA